MKDNEKPLVTVILTAYNHQQYIEECLGSVLNQTYMHIQLIVVDNASTDKTLTLIQDKKISSPDFLLIKNLYNKGLCTAFNQALAHVRGKYLIDLSGDDVLLVDRIEKQVEIFESLSNDYRVMFSNARYIDSNSKQLGFHYPINADGKALMRVPTGDVYKNVLERYFICTPTMMMRTDAVRELGGYDDSLKFEDFDFWVRSAIRFKYFFQDEVLTYKRISPSSLSTLVYKKGSGMLASYYTVCNKAYDLNRDQEEFDLLAARIRTFIRKCFYAQEFELALKFRMLLNYIENPGWETELVIFLCRIHLPVNWIYRLYLKHFQKVSADRKDLGVEIVN